MRNHLIAAHGFLTREEEKPMYDLKAILLSAFIVAVIAVAIAGWWG